MAFEELQTKSLVRYEDLPLESRTGKSIQVEFVSNVYAVGHEKAIQCNIRDITASKQADRDRLKLEAQVAKPRSWRLSERWLE